MKRNKVLTRKRYTSDDMQAAVIGCSLIGAGVGLLLGILLLGLPT